MTDLHCFFNVNKSVGILTKWLDRLNMVMALYSKCVMSFSGGTAILPLNYRLLATSAEFLGEQTNWPNMAHLFPICWTRVRIKLTAIFPYFNCICSSNTQLCKADLSFILYDQHPKSSNSLLWQRVFFRALFIFIHMDYGVFHRWLHQPAKQIKFYAFYVTVHCLWPWLYSFYNHTLIFILGGTCLKRTCTQAMNIRYLHIPNKKYMSFN